MCFNQADIVGNQWFSPQNNTARFFSFVGARLPLDISL